LGKVLGGGKLSGIMEYFNIIGTNNFSLIGILPNPAKSSSEYLNLNYLLNLFKYRSIERNLQVTNEIDKLLKKENEI